MAKAERGDNRMYIDQAALRERLTGWEIHLLEEVDSTNSYAKTLTAERAIVIAQKQSGGRGRLGRSFHSATGGLYLSVRLPVTFAAAEAQLLTSIASVATSDAIASRYKKRCAIKWINDLYYQEKKVCGILTEGVVEPSSGTLTAVVVGIGINLLTEIPASLQEEATSLFDPLAVASVDATALVEEIVTELERIVVQLPDRSYLTTYRKHSLLLNRAVVVWEQGVGTEAVAVDVDEWARLVVRKESGEEWVLSSPEISIRLVR